MSMTDIFRSLGRADALKLREEAASLNGTQIIDREHCAPTFDPAKDYTGWPKDAPVTEDGQVWLLLIPHNAAHYPGLRPSTNRACWGLAHTTDPKKAKPWVNPHGTSGLYKLGECYKAKDGTVKRCLVEQTEYDAEAMPSYWETVALA